jgi:hypothetical protein
MTEETNTTNEAVAVQAEASTDWRASLPEDIRGSKVFDSVQDINSLAKQFVDAQSHIGNSIRIPGEDASAEAVDAFHQKIMNKTNLMVRPTTSEDYQKVFESMGKPEDGKGYVNPEGVDGYEHLRELALNANMTNKQFKSMVNSVAGLDATALESQQATQKESRAVVEGEWGAAFDQNSSQAIALLEATGAPESIIALAKEGDIDGDSLKWFHALSQKITGGAAPNAVGDNGHNQVMTPAEATAQLGEIMSNKDSPYWNTSDPRHKEFQDKAMALRKLRNGKAA